MSLNNLRLNKDKTELLCLYSKHRSITSLPPLRFGKDTIHPSYSARTIGVIFDSTMSMLPYVNSVCILQAWLKQFSQLYNVPKYVLKKLQSVQNAAARLITCSRKYDHITPVLSDLHWIPVNERITIQDPAAHPQGSTPTSAHLHSRFGNWLFTAQNSPVIQLTTAEAFYPYHEVLWVLEP